MALSLDIGQTIKSANRITLPGRMEYSESVVTDAEILSELPIFDSDLRRIGDKSAQKCLYLLVF